MKVWKFSRFIIEKRILGIPGERVGFRAVIGKFGVVEMG